MRNDFDYDVTSAQHMDGVEGNGKFGDFKLTMNVVLVKLPGKQEIRQRR